ncbi:MAG: hypothetical protein H7257_05010 [Taibaiella sp.]|nr:hypothetical protein [Taibaiella sp.]
MGCDSCGSAAGGKPSGCKSNGGCSTGGCNRLNVHDWLSSLPLHDGAKPYPVIEVSFNKGSRKEFFRNNTHSILEKNDWIAVEGVGGYDVGQVSLTGELVKLQMKKYSVTENGVTKRVLHPATDEEVALCAAQKDREPEVLIRSRAIARTLNLNMKLCEVEIQADSKKGTFFYTADQRVDFRELIKFFANDFKMKVEMRQIGARQESGKVGGIGSCGRELCCSTWLSDFKSVNTTAARYQNLSINQTKLSGQCGRLKCCLNYELDTYMDALSVFPHHADSLETVKGIAHLQKRDIFKNLMWYSFSDHNKQYPLSIDRVKEIIKMNKLGQKADELHPVEIETKAEKAGLSIDVGFVNDVGQITLKNLEKNNNKNKKKSGGGGKPNIQGNRPKTEQPKGGEQTMRTDRPDRGPRPQKQPREAGTNNPQQVMPPQNRPNPNQNRKPDQPAQGAPRPPRQPRDQDQQAQGDNPPQPRPPREQREPRPNQQPRPQNNQQNKRADQPARPQQGDISAGDQAQATQGDKANNNDKPANGEQQSRPPRPQRNRPQRNRSGGNNKEDAGASAPPPVPSE